MPSRALLSEQWQREDREERDRLRQLEGRLNTLLDQRHALIGQVRALSAKQKDLYNRRQVPQAEVERLHDEFGQLGKHLSELRSGCEKARQKLEESVVRRRELVLTFERSERQNPEQLKREIAELELRQQTRALPIEDENALIAELRSKAKELQHIESRKAIALEHEKQRREAEEAIVAARLEVDRLVEEMAKARADRDKHMVDIRAKLEAAGAMVAEMRTAGRARAELMTQVDTVSREIAEVEKEGRELLARSRTRREDARKILQEVLEATTRPPPERPDGDRGIEPRGTDETREGNPRLNAAGPTTARGCRRSSPRRSASGRRLPC